MPQMSVFLVEDDAAVREFFAEALRAEEFSVTALGLAGDLFDALRTRVPDVIVLDLGMPAGTMQGMEALVRLREVDAWRDIPVIIMSAFGDIVNRDITGRLGITAILAKPLVDMERLTAAIRSAARA